MQKETWCLALRCRSVTDLATLKCWAGKRTKSVAGFLQNLKETASCPILFLAMLEPENFSRRFQCWAWCRGEIIIRVEVDWRCRGLTPPATFGTPDVVPNSSQTPPAPAAHLLQHHQQPRLLVALQNTMSTITEEARQSGKPPSFPLDFNANSPPTIQLFPLSNYTFVSFPTRPANK